MRIDYLSRKHIICAQLVACAVSLEFGTQPEAVIAPRGADTNTRGTPAEITSRQISMYLTHTIFDCGFALTGRLFGRHGTTVKHACNVVEGYREDPVMDLRLVRLETFLKLSPGVEVYA